MSFLNILHPGLTPITPSGGSGDFDFGTASRTSGVAPLSVHFSAGFEEDTDDFFNYEYIWTCAGISGTWHDGKNKNQAKGPIAYFIFESADTYTVSLQIKQGATVLWTEYFNITVSDPDTYYSGTNTTCVNPDGDSDFTGKPTGAREVSTDDLTEVLQYATADNRILFKRGCSWAISSSLNWPDNGGAVTIGAYGAGTGEDSQGIYSNAPQITVTGEDTIFCDINDKQNWRIMDLYLPGASDSLGVCSGSSNMQRILFSRLKTTGFKDPIAWSRYNQPPLYTIDQMVIYSCYLKDAQVNGMYLGAERLGILGNIIENANESHVVRIWQGYYSVVSHNYISGSSLTSGTGRHALKLYGPGYSHFTETWSWGTPAAYNGLLENQTKYAVISDNVMGTSGPWPVMISPKDEWSEEYIYYVLFERNRIITEYGDASSTNVSIAMHVTAREITIRNNVLDGSESGNSYLGIYVMNENMEPAPQNVKIYNNTIYREDNTSGTSRTGISIGSNATGTIVKNNLISFPNASVSVTMISDASADAVKANNLLEGDPDFVDPNNVTPLSRDFDIESDSEAISYGTSVPVYEDFEGNVRPNETIDAGAFEYYE